MTTEMNANADLGPIAPALRRLNAALVALETTVEGRRTAGSDDRDLTIRELGAERVRLLKQKDVLSSANAEVSRRLENAISTLSIIVGDENAADS